MGEEEKDEKGGEEEGGEEEEEEGEIKDEGEEVGEEGVDGKNIIISTASSSSSSSKRLKSTNLHRSESDTSTSTSTSWKELKVMDKPGLGVVGYTLDSVEAAYLGLRGIFHGGKGNVNNNNNNNKNEKKNKKENGDGDGSDGYNGEGERNGNSDDGIQGIVGMDAATTHEIAVVSVNWYGRRQQRVLRFREHIFERVNPYDLSIRMQHGYSSVTKIELYGDTDLTLHFLSIGGEDIPPENYCSELRDQIIFIICTRSAIRPEIIREP